MRRGIFVLFLTCAALVAAVPTTRAQMGTPVVVLDGRGFGHGVGMAQWGAKYMADAGAGHDDILAKFYPGTELSTAEGTVRVAVYTSPDNRATLSFPDGGEVRSSPGGDQAVGFPVQVGPGGSVLVAYDGQYRVTPLMTAQSLGRPVIWEATASSSQDVGCGLLFEPPCPTTTTTTTTQPTTTTTTQPTTTTTTQPTTTTTTRTTTTTQPPGAAACGGGCPSTTTTTTSPPPTSSPATGPLSASPASPGRGPTGPSTSTSGAPVWAIPNGVTGVTERGRHYRGLLEATAGGGPLRLVNQLDVETYVKGMGEVPSTWPLEAIAAQAVVARTYALRAMSFSGELCDYDLCQVYIGADREAQGQNDAVDGTRGQVVTFGGRLASTVYSADAGGVTATTLEGFGTPEGTYPYLQVVRYDTPNPLPWRAEVALSEVASRFGYPGTVTDVKVGQAGPSGRALQVTLDGSAGPRAVDGRTFAAHLSLRSTLFQPRVTTDDNVPPPPPFGGTSTQALPEDSAAIRQASLTGDPTSLRGPNLSRLREWGNKLTSSQARSAHGATDLAASPLTWTAITVALAGTSAVFARGDMPSPFELQLIDGVRFPMFRWPAERVRIATPRAKPLPPPE